MPLTLAIFFFVALAPDIAGEGLYKLTDEEVLSRRILPLCFVVPAMLLVGIGFFRASMYTYIERRDGRLVSREHIGGTFTYGETQFPEVVDVFVVEAVADSIHKRKTYAYLVCLSDPLSGLCIAGFRTKSEAEAWCEASGTERFTIQTAAVERLVSPYFAF
ncbi:MAG: hypothetical protein AAF297_10715 [Planctomycetota bacterium]